MAAPEGNQFWKLRNKHGRDKIFETPQMLWEAACEYFEWCDQNPFIKIEQVKGATILPKGLSAAEIKLYTKSTIELPVMRPFTMQGLFSYLDCNHGYFSDFEANIKNQETAQAKGFSEVITRIRETIYNQKYSGAASGFFNANIIARDLGLIDRTEITKTKFKVTRKE